MLALGPQGQPVSFGERLAGSGPLRAVWHNIQAGMDMPLIPRISAQIIVSWNNFPVCLNSWKNKPRIIVWWWTRLFNSSLAAIIENVCFLLQVLEKQKNRKEPSAFWPSDWTFSKALTFYFFFWQKSYKYVQTQTAVPKVSRQNHHYLLFYMLYHAPNSFLDSSFSYLIYTCGLLSLAENHLVSSWVLPAL